MPTSSGSRARTTGLRSHGPVDEQPSAYAGPVQPNPSRVQQSGTPLSPTVPSGSSGHGPLPLPMTVLPVPALCVDPDATKTAPPQCDSSALQSAQELTLAEVVEDLARNLQICRMQTQEAHLIAQDSLAQAAGLRTEVQHLRSQLEDLESIVMRELIQDLPEEEKTKKTKKEPPSRNRSKTVSNKKGDALNRYKTKASSDEERTSCEEADSSDDEEGPMTYPEHTMGRPLGRRVRGLVELQTRLPEYQGLVSYRSYRLKDTEAVIDENDTGKVNGILKRIKHHFSYSFGGEIPLKVLDFLSTVKEAMDLNHVSEGVAAIILPYLLTGEAKDGVIAMWKSTSLKVPKYPAAVAWLLESYATDAAIDAAADKFLTAKQQAGEGEDAFATRLRRYAAEAGNVYKEDALVSRYLAGLASYTANTIRGHVSPRMRFTQVKNLAVQAGIAGREAGVPSRSSTRGPVPGLLTPRLRGVVAPVEGIRSASTFSQTSPYDMGDNMVAAAEYASYDRDSSELSGPTSEISCPSRGWVSVAATERPEPAMAVMARLPGCHVCYGKDHFLIDCPLLSTEVRQRIAVQRAQQIQQDRGGSTAGGGEPSLRAPYAQPSTNGAPPGFPPRPASQPPRPSYMPTPTWGPRPRYTGGGRPQQAPAVVSHVQQDEPRPTEEELQVETPAAKNFAGDV